MGDDIMHDGCTPGSEMTWVPADDFERDAAYPSHEDAQPAPDDPEQQPYRDAVLDAFFGDPPGTAYMRRKNKKMADDGFDPPIRNRSRRMDARTNRFYRTASDTPDFDEESRLPAGALRLFATMGSAPLMEMFAKAALAAQEETNRFPVEPPEGSVLRYQKQFPNSPKTYTYVALRAGDQWYRTGKDTKPWDWSTLVEDIANWPCHVAIKWGEIPQAPASLFEGVDPAVWFEEMYQNTVTVEENKKD